jgi:hypothetical protein
MCKSHEAVKAAEQKPPVKCEAPAPVCPEPPKPIKISFITIKQIKFLTDHGLMKDNTANYKDEGAVYPRTHWSNGGSVPISHSSYGDIRIEMTISVGPPGAVPESGNIDCKYEGEDFLYKEAVTFSPGEFTVVLANELQDEKNIGWNDMKLDWALEGISVPISPASTNHVVALTAGVPQGFNDDNGITYKRMYEATHLLRRYNPVRPHFIVSKLMGILKYYVLSPNPNVPDIYSHPTYYNSEGGAWPMMDYKRYYGECQAIVRFVGSVIKQVGVDGTAELVYVFAEPANPGVAVESADANNYQGCALVDKEVQVGQVYPPNNTVLDDDSVSPGFNNYEACLKFTHGGSTKYYGGGTGGHGSDTAQQVILSFFALVRYEGAYYPDDLSPQRVIGFKIVEILATRDNW